MQDLPSLLSRMKDPYRELQDQDQEIHNFLDPYLRDNPQLSDTQPTDADERPSNSARTSAESNSEFYQDVLVRCNSLVERYRKGEIPKVSVYVEIQSKLSEALGIRE